MDIITKVNWVDILVLILLIRISYVAFQEGLSREIFPLMGSLIMSVLGLHYYGKIAAFLSENLIRLPIEVLKCLSFLALIVGAGFIFKLAKVFLDKIVKVEWHPAIEKFGGLIAGAARASITASLILIILALLPLDYFQRSIRDRSLTGMHFLRVAPNVYEKVSRFLPTIKVEGKAVNKEELIKNLASDKSIFKDEKKEKKPARRERWQEELE